MSTPSPAKSKSRRPFERFLAFVEWLGNLLPHPATLFLILAVLVLLLSEVATWFDLSAAHPGEKNPDGRARGESTHPRRPAVSRPIGSGASVTTTAPPSNRRGAYGTGLPSTRKRPSA